MAKGTLVPLLALLAAAAALTVTVLTAQSRSAAVEMTSNGPLIAHLRVLLAQKAADKQQHSGRQEIKDKNVGEHAELAAAAQQWKSKRSDWMPYNPSMSLQQNKVSRQAAGDARETELNERDIVHRLATHARQHAGAYRPHARARLERYQANMYNQPKKACSDWGAHPIDCIRSAYGNHLKGTKFAHLRRRYDGRVTEDSLDQERNLISKKVSEGLIKGSIKPPKHDKAVTSWLHRVKDQMHAARKLAMQRALAARIKGEERHSDETKLAKEWGSGLVASGPEEGRRYYTNYENGRTKFSAPTYVKRALKDIRLRKKAKAQHAVQHEAALYEEGFRAAQRAILLKEGRTMSLNQVPTTSLIGQRRLEQIHAEKAINNFLQKGGRHPKARAYTWKDLANERERIAHELGFKSLTHQDGRAAAAPVQQLHEEAHLHQQQKVIVDAWGHPLTHRPTAQDYPMGSGDYEQPKPPAASAPVSAAAQSTDTEAAVARAVSSVATAVKQKTDALQSEVSAQQAIINDLEHKVAHRTRASERSSAQAIEATDFKSRRDSQPKPAMGSFELAKFANNLGTGTAVVDTYENLKERADYAAVANRGGQLRSPKDFAAVRDEVQREVAFFSLCLFLDLDLFLFPSLFLSHILSLSLSLVLSRDLSLFLVLTRVVRWVDSPVSKCNAHQAGKGGSGVDISHAWMRFHISHTPHVNEPFHAQKQVPPHT